MRPPVTAPLPQNILSVSVREREWNGVLVETAEFICRGRAVHLLGHEDKTRLSVVLDEQGGRCEPRLSEHAPCRAPHAPRHMALAPAGMPLWGYSDDIRFVRDATLCFDLDALSEQLGECLDADAIRAPRLGFNDDRIWILAKLLADACKQADPAAQLYGDGLVTAISALLSNRVAPEARPGKGLAPWQLRRAVAYMEANLPARIGLRDLATQTGLSQSHFSRAFRISTGQAPYQWQLDARIRRAKNLLLQTGASLDEIAEATGFADSTHLAHTFRRRVGTTPVAWRRSNR